MINAKSKIRVLDIIRGTTVDGPGFRTSIYFAGCHHQCPGCHNPQSWDFLGGEEMSIQQILDIIAEEDFDVTFSGGDPLYHLDEIEYLTESIHRMGHSVWLYTGFTWDEIISSAKLLSATSQIDVIVDGPFIEAQKMRDLLFKGSLNQRIIDVSRSLQENTIVLWDRD